MIYMQACNQATYNRAMKSVCTRTIVVTLHLSFAPKSQRLEVSSNVNIVFCTTTYSLLPRSIDSIMYQKRI